MNVRVPILIGLSEKVSPADLKDLPGFSHVELVANNLWRLVVGEHSYTMRKVKDWFACKDGTFSLWMILQNNMADYRPGTRLMRFLYRAALSDGDGIIHGPYSPKELKEIEIVADGESSAFGDGESPRVPWVMMGESPEDMFKTDYRPDAKDASDDIEVTPQKFLEVVRAGA